MCGIAGFTRFNDVGPDPHQLLERMGNAILHRGPDAGGIYVDDKVGLCHRRLSIIDLSPTGAQPMKSRSGRFVAVYNGEIYNFRELRKILSADGIVCRGGSDTEVLVELYDKMGPDCLDLLNGMFAIAIWDTQSNKLFLARDRLGKKPLYFYHANNKFAFASEIKSILCLPGMDNALRSDAIKDYFTFHYVPDPKSIFKHIHKLSPGHWMSVDADGTRIKQYWDVSFQETRRDTQEVIQEELYSLLEDSVRMRMVSDVPLGAFLSGGVDSSAVVGLMAKNSETPVTTCSIGFDSEKFDEIQYAKAISERFATDHHEFTVKENVEQHLIEIASYFDEPFADSSFIPTYFVSKLARQRVTVALAGDGGDENFAGYTKYKTDKLENSIRGMMPRMLRRRLFPGLAGILSKGDHAVFRKGSSLLNSLSYEADHGFFISNSFFNERLWDNLILGDFKKELSDYDVAENTKQHYANADTEDHLSSVLYTDIKTYLPGDILVKVDRMSMANSLETRAPILDYRVVEYAATIPSTLKLNGNDSKHVLKKSLAGLLPDDILYRSKMGFSVPISHWLKFEIKDIVSQYLFSSNSGLSNYFDMQQLANVWATHQQGTRDYSSEIWSLFMFELWWQRYMESP